jgi:long-chain acyl-CoA synthetase
MPEWIWEKSYPPGVSWVIEPAAKPVHAILDEAITKWPKNYACDFLDKKLTYADLGDLVDRAAKGFQELGVGKGVHVGLFLPNTPHYIVCFFAILKAGGTVVNYSPLDAEAELEHKIEDSQTDILVTLDLALLYSRMAKMLERTRLKKLVIGSLPDFLPFPKNLLFPLVRKKDIAAIPRDDRHVRFKQLIGNDGRYQATTVADPAEEVAVLQYTGGTTGLPKGAMLTHRNLVAATDQFQNWSNSEPPLVEEGVERTLTVLPLFHIYALTVILLNGIAGGAELILHPRFELNDVMRDLGRKRPTVFPGVPTMYTAILGHPNIDQTDLTSLKVCNSGGAPLPPELQRQFEAKSGCRLVEGWGMTETCSPGTANHVLMQYKVGSAGIPLPGIVIEFTDVDDPDKVVPHGERGEICITGPNVMKGYWNKPEETAEAFRGGRFHTGDVGYMDDDGYVFIVDRMKDMILSGGFNVYPRNIEDAIYQHPSVSECTVIGVPDEYRGQAAKAFVTLVEGAQPFTLEELRSFLDDKLGRHEMPAQLEIRKELPKTPVGKLSKKELYAEEAEKRAAGTT